MTEPMIRGHVIAHTARFAREHIELASPYGFAGGVTPELNATLETIATAGWYPRRYEVELLEALAHARGRTDDARRDLQRCGSALAAMDNQFMSLLMRLMTPQLFIRKLPLFWKRDHQGSGMIEIDHFVDSANQAKIRLVGIAGYDHAALLWLGWIKHVLDGLCGGRAEVSQAGWSWPQPGPGEILFDVRWS